MPYNKQDFIIEKEGGFLGRKIKEGVSLFGIGGFSYETEKLLGISIDVVPLSTLPQVNDQEFLKNIQEDAIQAYATPANEAFLARAIWASLMQFTHFIQRVSRSEKDIVTI